MNVRREFQPGLYTVTDEDTGEVLIFSFYGNLPYVRLFELIRIDPHTGQRRKNALFSDYA